MRCPVRPAVVLLGLTPFMLAGCSEADKKELAEFFGRKRTPTEQEVIESATLRVLRERAKSLAVQDTIGAVSFLQGRRLMRVRGYGIVVGLGEEGSREMPEPIRDKLLQEMRKHHHLGSSRAGLKDFSPENMLDSLDTAAVLVSGEIPAASLKGARFDATVEALPGTQTRSLAGGHLWRCDLYMYRETAAGNVSEGRALAYAEGPIYIEPFTQQADSPTRVDPRRGRLLGGGTNVVDRPIHLELYQPSYQQASAIARRINARFPCNPKVADAVAPGAVNLTIPPSYRADPDRFLELVTHVYLPDHPAFVERRARELAVELTDPQAPHDDIGLAWEGLGRTILPVIRELYGDQRPHVAYHAARTGLRLNDELAVEVLRRFAHDTQSKFQPLAIRELGLARGLHQSASALRPLLSAEDPRVRGWAYEALRGRGDRAIRTLSVGGGDFYLDLVDADGPPLLRATTAEEPRLAIFGRNLSFRPPVFYTAPDETLILNAEPDDKNLTLIRRWPQREGLLSFKTSLDVAEVVARLGADSVPAEAGDPPGAELSYSQIIEALYYLCETQRLEAKFVLEKPRLSDLLRPLRPTGRPMTDLD